MVDWMSPSEAMSYLGIGNVELTELIRERNMDVQLEGNTVTAIDAADCRDALFDEHEKREGYRPDDPDMVQAVQAIVEEEEAQQKDERQQAVEDAQEPIEVPEL